MIRKWVAVVLLALAASPVTAPFQTFHFGDSVMVGDPSTVVVESAAATSSETDPGSLVPPLRTRSGRLSLAQDLRVIVTSSIAFAPIVGLTFVIDPPDSPPVSPSPRSPGVLRI